MSSLFLESIVLLYGAIANYDVDSLSSINQLVDFILALAGRSSLIGFDAYQVVC